MTAVEALDEDDLLLNGMKMEHNFDNVDEEALLGPLSRTNTVDFDIDSAEKELLGEDLNDDSTCPDASFDREELDYDEDEDEVKEERVGRFTSERNKGTTSTITPNNDKPVMTTTNGTQPLKKRDDNNKRNRGNNRGNFNNRGRGQGWNNRGGNMPNRGRGGYMNNYGPPSLLTMQMEPPMLINQNGGGPMMMPPNFIQPPPQGQQPLVSVRLNIPGAPPIVMGPPVVPSMPPMVPNNLGGPIVPRLPNGIPLIPVPNQPSNHGMAGFGNVQMNRNQPQMGNAGFGNPPGGWDQKVMEFINNPGARKSRRRSSSYSSRSHSSSYSGRSRSRSRSRSPRRHKTDRNRRNERGGDNRRNGDRNYRGKRGGRGANNSGNRRYDRPDRPRREDKERVQVAAECAKVVGVDKEYLSKVEEQKRLREEVMRMKEQRRHGHEEKPKAENNEMKKSHNSRNQSHNNNDVNGISKKKAFLCVNVKNLKQLPTALNRVESLAKEFGSIRKVWKFNDDQVNIIFTELEKAKAFMLKYNNKVLSGLRIQVSLEKAYLSLAEMQG